MIHAYLFLTDRRAASVDDGHGPAFKKWMYRINEATGLNVTIFHNFHDEVNYYRQHVWRCNGVCKDRPPFYGYVKRSMNRKPQRADKWWAEHQLSCGG